MWLFHLFINKTASAVINSRFSAKHTDKKHRRLDSGKSRDFTIFPQVVSFLLKKYATGEVIEETESGATRLAQPSGRKPSQYVEELVKKTLRCRDVYEKYALNYIYIEGFDSSICHSMREHWEGKKKASLQDLAFHATSLLRLQENYITFKKTNASATKL